VAKYSAFKYSHKDGFISESFSLWLKSRKKDAIMTEHYAPKEKMLRVVFWHLFGDLSESEKLPLVELHKI
jgi:hypothetical protein